MKKNLKCLACGNCCKYMLLTPAVSYDGAKEWLKYHEVDLVKSPTREWSALRLSIPCRMLSKDGKCLIYDKRPDTCKVFPVGLIPEWPRYEDAKDKLEK